MKAIILAAGIGNRLRPITKMIPKALVKVAGKPILGYQIEGLMRAGVKEIVICLGYRPKEIVSFCKNSYPGANFEFVFNREYKKTNNMYSFYLARKFLNNDILIMNGDIIFDSKIIWEMLKRRGSLVAVDTGCYLEESMKVRVNDGGFICDISKKINKNDVFGCSIDIYKFTKNDLGIIKKELKKIIEKERELNLWTEVLFQRLFNSGRLKTKSFDIGKKKWWEIDNFADLDQAEKIFNNRFQEINRKKFFFIDGDGTLILGNKKIEGADKFIDSLNKKKIPFRILTNNSSRTNNEHYQKLRRLGFKIKEKNILSSSDSLINYLIKNRIRSVYLLANRKVTNFFVSKGFNLDFREPEAVVLTYDTEINYKKLVLVDSLIKRGLPYFVTHTDNLCPTEKGLVPDIGTFIKILEMSTGRIPDKAFGKPSKALIAPILQKYRLRPKDCVIIGDRLYTDIEMAKEMGALSVLVLSGETKREGAEFSKTQPDIIVQNVKELIPFL